MGFSGPLHLSGIFIARNDSFVFKMEVDMKKRFFLRTTAALAASLAFAGAQAQTTPIKFQLDWRFEGPSALFLTPLAKGYFKARQAGCHGRCRQRLGRRRNARRLG